MEYLPKPSVSPKLCKNSKTISKSDNAFPVNFRPGRRSSIGNSFWMTSSESSWGFRSSAKISASRLRAANFRSRIISLSSTICAWINSFDSMSQPFLSKKFLWCTELTWCFFFSRSSYLLRSSSCWINVACCRRRSRSCEYENSIISYDTRPWAWLNTLISSQTYHFHLVHQFFLLGQFLDDDKYWHFFIKLHSNWNVKWWIKNKSKNSNQQTKR